VIGIVVAGRVLPDLPGDPVGPIDRKGFFLAGAAASGIVFGLSFVSLPALPPVVGLATLLLGALCAIAYVRHARQSIAPILDLRLMAQPAPRVAVVSGSLFRIGVGAIPFLLPLMFQIGFGLNAFQSGMLTFASAFGAIAVKVITTRLLRAVGFRTTLMVSCALGSVLMGANALFTPQTPYWVIIVVLIAAGFMRSLFFTSNNALVFAEIDDKQAAQATAIAAVSQQISIAMGVATAGLILEAHHIFTGQEIGLAAFSTAFIIVSVIAATALIVIYTLSPSAGMTVSGHLRAKPGEEPRPPSSV
jgi:MFS family permease